MGVAGSGKTLIGSRFAEALGVAFVEGDAYHPPENVARMAAGIPLSDADRAGWLEAIAARLADAARADVGLVVSCSALKRRYRDVLRTADPALTFVYLAGPRDLVAERLTHRQGHFMPPSMLDSQIATLEPPTADERAWLCDVTQAPDTIVAGLVARAAVAPLSRDA